METTRRQHGGPASSPIRSRRSRGLALGGLILLLSLDAPAPARATSGPIVVGVGQTLNIDSNASVTVGDFLTAVVVQGGTVNISGGSVTAGAGGIGVLVEAGTVNISGGSVTTSRGGRGVLVQAGTVNIFGGSVSVSGAVPPGRGVEVDSGTVRISGGTISAVPSGVGVFTFGGTASISGGTISGGFAVQVGGGTVSISGGSIFGGGAFGVVAIVGVATLSGCNLVLSNPTPFTFDFGVAGIFSGTLYSLTGTLRDGTAINTNVYQNHTKNGAVLTAQIVLDDHCSPSDIAHLVRQFVTDPAVVQGLIDKLNAIAAAIAQGNAHAKAGAVRAFINQVKAQTGKSITAQQAAILIRLVMEL